MRTKLETYDKDSIIWDLRQLSIFFPKPIKVEIPGFEPEYVGNGFGGFSWTLFTRGFGCTSCGGCCRAPKSGDFSHRCWYWYETEMKPVGQTQSVVVMINDEPLILHVHLNNRPESCDFLVDEPTWVPLVDEVAEMYENHKIELVQDARGFVPLQYCMLHNDHVKPSHCLWSPGTETFSTGKTRRLLLSRRLPGRNWAWPKCPIDVTNFPIRQQDIDLDRRMLALWAESTRHIPGNSIDRGVSLWEQATFNASQNRPPAESIHFSAVWS